MGAVFDGFVHPGLAWLAALAVVPLLIHLLNRQRFKPLQWAAMRFVLAAYRKTRRRARLENLILLLLRMGAVALLALAIARPFAGAHSPLSAMTESRRDMVLVIDGSASMGYREDVRTVFDRTIARARELLTGLDGARGDRVRMILAAAQPRLLSWRTPEEALDLLDTLSSPSDEPLDLAAAMGEVARYVEDDSEGTEPGSLEVRLLTDLQRRSFVPEVGASQPSDIPHAEAPPGAAVEHAPALVEQLDRLRARGLRVLVEDLGPAEAVPANLAVLAVEPTSGVIAPGVPVDISVSLANYGPTVRAGVRVVLVQDGQRLPHKLVEIPGRGQAKVVFQVAFRERGEHTLVASVDADRLGVDDSRAAVIHVPPAVRVLLVDGEPAPEIDRDEVGYLGAVLAPARGDEVGGEGASSPFEVRVIQSPELSDTAFDLSAVDVVWLANVEGLSARTVERLEARVASGAALIVSAGKNVRREAYATRLFRADGSGLLPAELGANISIPRDEGYFRIASFDVLHPALAFFADERWKPLFTEVPFYQFIACRPLDRARVLASFDDAQKSPALIERDYDRGRVFLWTSSIDSEWTRLPESPRTLVPFAHELVRYAGQPRAPQRNIGVNAALAAQSTRIPRRLTLVLPDGTRKGLDGDAQPAGPGAWTLPPVTTTERAGLYKIEIEGGENIAFAVQLDAREGDLDRLSPGELLSVHPSLVAVSSTSGVRRESDDPEPQRGELWRGLAAACFVFLVLESLWAAWVGRSRSMR